MFSSKEVGMLLKIFFEYFKGYFFSELEPELEQESEPVKNGPAPQHCQRHVISYMTNENTKEYTAETSKLFPTRQSKSSFKSI